MKIVIKNAISGQHKHYSAHEVCKMDKWTLTHNQLYLLVFLCVTRSNMWCHLHSAQNFILTDDVTSSTVSAAMFAAASAAASSTNTIMSTNHYSMAAMANGNMDMADSNSGMTGNMMAPMTALGPMGPMGPNPMIMGPVNMGQVCNCVCMPSLLNYFFFFSEKSFHLKSFSGNGEILICVVKCTEIKFKHDLRCANL